MAKKPGDTTEKPGKKGKKAPADPDAPTLSAHPKAQRHIRAAKAYGGLGTFVLVGWMASATGMPAFDAGLRALMAGVASYMLTWCAAVIVWRQVAVAQVHLLHREVVAAREAAIAARREAA